MRRVIILLMDSFGIGASQDAEVYGDAGANTFASIAQYCAEHQLAFALPNLQRLGLGLAATASSGLLVPGMNNDIIPAGQYGYAVELSHGKDTPSGHWEIAGVPVLFDWGYFPKTIPCFPQALTDKLIERTHIPGILGNKHASGTEIIAELGTEHIKSGKPIIYTSADSVFQIAAHEDYFGLDRLYQICEVARHLVDDYNIGRVIARPFTGEAPSFIRTANRRDYAVLPPATTVLDKLKAKGGDVISIGKISDIFAHQGITQQIKAAGNKALFAATIEEVKKKAEKESIIFCNFVDFDSLYGHRRDVSGYAAALKQFDALLPVLEQSLQEDDMVIITADHGCDPTAMGSDHTREHIPVLVFGPKIKSEFIGRRDTFADIGQTIADYLDLSPMDYGVSFYARG